MAGRDARGRCLGLVPPGQASLAPPWAPAATVLAVLATALIAGLVWHSHQLPGLDAWVEDRLGARTDRQFQLAWEVANGLRGLTVLGVLATAAAAWVVLRRWNAVALALLAPAGTLAAELLLKPLVARRAPGSATFHYPSGHVAVTTALAVSLVLLVRLAWARTTVRLATIVATSLLVIAMALAVLVATAHLFSDVVGGVATGVAVTLAAAWLLDRSVRGRLLQLQPDGLGQAAEQDQAGDGLEDPSYPIQPATVARMLVGNSSAASAPMAEANTDAAATARRYPAIAAAAEPLYVSIAASAITAWDVPAVTLRPRRSAAHRPATSPPSPRKAGGHHHRGGGQPRGPSTLSE